MTCHFFIVTVRRARVRADGAPLGVALPQR